MKINYKANNANGNFEIFNPETGKDWGNFLWNDAGYLMYIGHTGNTSSRYVDENSNQVTLNCPLANYVYLRDEATKKYWNIGINPVCEKVEDYKCVHGQGFSEISSTVDKIAGKITYAVAKNDTYEVWKVCIKNNDTKIRNISSFAVTAFDLNGYAQPVYYSAVTTSETKFVEDANAVFCDIRNPYAPNDNCFGYIASSEEAYSYDGNLEKFIGTVGSFTKPYTLENGLDCSKSLATVRNRGGIIENKLELKPGEEKTIYYILGLTKGEETLRKIYPGLLSEAKKLFADLLECGMEKFGKLRTLSPNARINNIMNFWAEKQVSYCFLGKKAVRDNAQLAMGMLNYDVSLAKKTVVECLEHQYSDGHAVLTWYPYLEPNIYSDPSVWLIFCVCEYIKETGDFDFLNQEMKYLDRGSCSTYLHLKKAIEWFNRPDNYGANGLPRIHHADWNDALNIPDDKAESVFMAMAICWATEELAALADFLKDYSFASELRLKKKELTELTNTVAWNGDYYIRAISRFGKVGDKDSTNGGNIYVNPQSWAILADIVPQERLQKVLDAIDGMETNEGIPLCSPAYKTYDKTVGRMSGMLPGVYENGGIYNHAGAFKVMADCKLKRKTKALSTLLKIIPDGEFNPSSKTTTEPYVFTNCYLKHPSVDMMVGFSWQTGSSAWGLRCYYEGILGLVRTYEGLKISPCMPDEWTKVSATRNYRGNKLEIEFSNFGGDRVMLKVDGVEIDGDVAPNFADNLAHKIEVKLI